MQGWGLQPAEPGPHPDLSGRPGKLGGTSWQGGGGGRPSAVPYCPSAYCLVHALYSEDNQGQWGNVIFRLLFPSLAPRPQDDTRRMPPWGGGRGSAMQEAAPQASLIISLATAAAKLLVGRFFLAPWVGVFFLHPPEGWDALGKRSAYHVLRAAAPGPCSTDSSGHWEPVQEQAKSDQEHA